MKSNTTNNSTVKVFPALMDDDLNSDAFLAELDIAFDEIQMTTPTPSVSKRKNPFARKAKSKTKTISAMQATYIDLARNHLKPISRYLKAFRQGITSKDLLEVVSLILEPLTSQTKKVGLDDHAQVLRSFQKTLKSTLRGKNKRLTDVDINGLVFAFAPVNKTFDLSFRGHSTAVLNVLAFYQSLKKSKKISSADMKKLFAIGIPSMTMLRQTSIEELMSLTGISAEKVNLLRQMARTFTLFELV